MPEPAPRRPRLVTVAGVTAIAACVLMVGVLFEATGSLRSSENQDAIRDFLSTPPGSGLGLGVGEVLDLLHVVVLVSGALAAAGAVLGAYSLRRHRGARVGLSVVAVAMIFTTTFVAGLLPFVVAIAAAMLWRQEARDWFDGRERRTHPRAPREVAPLPAPPTHPLAPPAAGPRPGPFAGPPPPSPYAAPGPSGATAYAGPPVVRRPASVVAATAITWVFAGLTLLLMSAIVVFLVLDPGYLLDELLKNPRVVSAGYSRDGLFVALWAVVAVGIGWSLAAIALAVLAFRGVRAGQVGLLASAVVSALVGLTSVVVPVAAVATIVLLLRRSAQAWFSRPRR